MTDLSGSPVPLAGWATWCVPRERELPALDAFAATLDRLDVDLRVGPDTDQMFLPSYEGSMMPYPVLLDRDGEAVHAWTGSLDTEGDNFLTALAEVTS